VRAFLIICLAGVMAFAAMEPPALKAVEAAINDRFRSGLNDPFDLLGPRAAAIYRGMEQCLRWR
jgi:hypothetical protein